MTITIYGAGAIGGMAGAHMARAGQDVLMVDKVAEHVEAMNKNGLRITGGADFTARVRACTPDQLKGPLGLTFLAVKSYDTDAAMEVIAPLVGPETVVVSMQNGMNPPRIAARIGADKTLGVFVNYGADWHGPGHVEHGGHGSLWVGELDGKMTDRLYRIRDLLANLHPTTATNNIYGYLWSKQTYRCMNAAESMTNETMAGLFGNKRWQPLLIALVSEGVEVALAAGAKLESFGYFEPLKLHPKNEAELAEAMAVLDRYAASKKDSVKVHSGVWRDIAVRHRPTEIDTGIGEVVAEGKRRGIDARLNARVVRMIKEIEKGERQQGTHNLEELERYWKDAK